VRPLFLKEHRGLTVPRDMHDRVAALLNEANPTIPIRSELAGIDVPATPARCDSRLWPIAF
jgi:hypothetical protein